MISGNGGMKRPHHITELLNFKPNNEYYYIYIDHRTQLQYLLSGKEIAEHGFRIHLFGYQYRVCLHFKEIFDAEGKFEKLYQLLNGKGVTSVDEALKEMELLPLHIKYENFFSYDNMEKVRTYLVHKPDKKKKDEVIALPGKLDKELDLLATEFSKYLNGKTTKEKFEKKFHNDLSDCRNFFQFWQSYNNRKSVTRWMKSCDEFLPVNSKLATNREYLTFINLLVLKQLFGKKSDNKKINILFDELLLSKPLTNLLQKQSNGTNIYQRIDLIKTLLISFPLEKKKSDKTIDDKKTKVAAKSDTEKNNIVTSIKVLLCENIVHNFLRVNDFEGTTYFNKERFEEFLKWILLFNLTQPVDKHAKKKQSTKTEIEKEILVNSKNIYERFIELIDKAESCGYDFVKFTKEIDKIPEIIVKRKKLINQRKKK
jgi:hypothetical protein